MTETISASRLRRMLRTAMGDVLTQARTDPEISEIMVNPDGHIRVDRLGQGRVETGHRLERAEVERIIRLVASHVRAEVHQDSPIVSAELPAGEGLTGERPATIAYPYGSRAAVSERDYAIARELGFSVAVTTQPGTLCARYVNRLTGLPRISLNGYYQQPRYVSALASGIPFAIGR